MRGLVAVALVAFGATGCGYNTIQTNDEAAGAAKQQISVQLQRRADLVGNLVNTVKGAANFEQETLTKLVEARAKATSINLKADELTPENMQKFQDALGSAIPTPPRTLTWIPDLAFLREHRFRGSIPWVAPKLDAQGRKRFKPECF